MPESLARVKVYKVIQFVFKPINYMKILIK